MIKADTKAAKAVKAIVAADPKAKSLFEEAVRYQRDADAILRSATTDAEVAEAELRNGFYRDTAKRLQNLLMGYFTAFADVDEEALHAAIVLTFTEAVHAA